MPTICALGRPSTLDTIAILSKKEETIHKFNNATSILAKNILITQSGPPNPVILFINIETIQNIRGSLHPS